ncbi:MAG: Rieske 2Fe-2S domain-containing protein [Nitrososphaerota archaeon]|nr:Rieske 2Fe-2S domain-containing protein [Nitrososphaerota archaeon]MDG6923339.1 Rieske 2Fe-2S domain-containing protein [Nitrososphaerota archaeon]
MDRREFTRRLIIVSVLGATGAAGVVALAQKAFSVQPSASTIIQSQTPTLDPSTTNSTSSSTPVASASANTQASTTTTTSQSPSIPAGYLFLASLSALSGKTYAYFNHPSYGSSILINYSGAWKAFSAVCTHAGCTVDFTSSQLYCPCHAGYFSPVNGSVVSGPPPAPLPEFGITIINNNLYVSNSRIN